MKTVSEHPTFFTLTNVSDKVIDAYELIVCPFNIFGEALKSSGIGDECVKVSGNTVFHTAVEIPPSGFESTPLKGAYVNLDMPDGQEWWHQTSHPNLTLYGYETATRAEIRLTRVHFEDGTVWKEGELIPPQ